MFTRNKKLKQTKSIFIFDKPTDVDSSGFYYVEEIMEKKVINKKIYYKVKWDGFPLDECTWEPLDALSNVHNLIDKFEKTQKELKLKQIVNNKSNSKASKSKVIF